MAVMAPLSQGKPIEWKHCHCLSRSLKPPLLTPLSQGKPIEWKRGRTAFLLCSGRTSPLAGETN